MRSGLFLEIVQMAVDTIRTQKMRSTLTILGILIGITSMVGMTSLVRGLDESLNETIQSIGPNTIFVMQFSGVSLTSGDDFFDMMQRPTLTPDDADAIARLAPSIASVNIVLGEGGPPTQSTLGYQGNYTKSISVLGSDRELPRDVLNRSRHGAFLQRGRGESSPTRGRPRAVPKRGVVPERRSDRQDGPPRGPALHGHRCHGTTTDPGRYGRGTRRLRGHPTHVSIRSTSGSG